MNILKKCCSFVRACLPLSRYVFFIETKLTQVCRYLDKKSVFSFANTLKNGQAIGPPTNACGWGRGGGGGVIMCGWVRQHGVGGWVLHISILPA